VHLVDERGPAVDQAELVLGVDQDQARAPCDLLAAAEDRKGSALDLLPQVGRDQAARDDLLRGETLVVGAAGGLRRGGDHRLGERIVLAQARRQVEAVRARHPLAVQRPQRSGGDAGDIAAHDHLDGQRLRLAREGDVGIGDGDDMICDHIARLLEPPGAELVEHLALEWDDPQDAIEGGDAIGGDQHALPIDHVDVAHLALQTLAQMRQIDARQGIRNGGLKLLDR